MIDMQLGQKFGKRSRVWFGKYARRQTDIGQAYIRAYYNTSHRCCGRSNNKYLRQLN